MSVTVSQPAVVTPGGAWSVMVSPCTAVDLLPALDPDLPFILIECGDPSLGWHEAPVSVGHDGPRTRRVRALHFDLLASPAEATRLAPEVDRSHDGSLTCYQFNRKPSSNFRLPGLEHPQGRLQAMTGLGVVLTVFLPHRHEVAQVASPDPTALAAFAARLRAQQAS